MTFRSPAQCLAGYDVLMQPRSRVPLSSVGAVESNNDVTPVLPQPRHQGEVM